MPKGVQGLAESACIAACASAATFPVLVLRGLSVSVWAMVSSLSLIHIFLLKTVDKRFAYAII